MRAFAVPVLLLAAAHGALAANFDTTIVTGEEVVTSIWETGYCGAIMTRNPGNNPSTSWAGLFTFDAPGAELTTGPNGNGIGTKLDAIQWRFEPTDPAQMAIFSNSTVQVTYCCETCQPNTTNVNFRVIFSYDYKGVGYNPPPPSPPPPSPPSPPPPSPPSPPPPSPPPPPPAPKIRKLAPAPAPEGSAEEPLVAGAPEEGGGVKAASLVSSVAALVGAPLPADAAPAPAPEPSLEDALAAVAAGTPMLAPVLAPIANAVEAVSGASSVAAGMVAAALAAAATLLI